MDSAETQSGGENKTKMASPQTKDAPGKTLGSQEPWASTVVRDIPQSWPESLPAGRGEPGLGGTHSSGHRKGTVMETLTDGDHGARGRPLQSGAHSFGPQAPSHSPERRLFIRAPERTRAPHSLPGGAPWAGPSAPLCPGSLQCEKQRHPPHLALVT